MNKYACDGLDCDTCITTDCPNEKKKTDEVFNTSLTKKEIETLELIVRGYSNAQIAGKMVVEYTTVKTHLASIYQKFNHPIVGRTTEASVLRLRLALKYLESKGYLNWGKTWFKCMAELKEIKVLLEAANEANDGDTHFEYIDTALKKVKGLLNE